MDVVDVQGHNPSINTQCQRRITLGNHDKQALLIMKSLSQEGHTCTTLSGLVLLNHIKVPVLMHAGHIGTDRSLLTGHNALLLRKIAKDLLDALSHRHDYKWTAFLEPVVSTGDKKVDTHCN